MVRVTPIMVGGRQLVITCGESTVTNLDVRPKDPVSLKTNKKEIDNKLN